MAEDPSATVPTHILVRYLLGELVLCCASTRSLGLLALLRIAADPGARRRGPLGLLFVGALGAAFLYPLVWLVLAAVAGASAVVLLVCGRRIDAKSALAVEYLLQFGVDAVAVAGGLKGWDAGGLELVDAFEEDEDDDEEDDDE